MKILFHRVCVKIKWDNTYLLPSTLLLLIMAGLGRLHISGKCVKCVLLATDVQYIRMYQEHKLKKNILLLLYCYYHYWCYYQGHIKNISVYTINPSSHIRWIVLSKSLNSQCLSFSSVVWISTLLRGSRNQKPGLWLK